MGEIEPLPLARRASPCVRSGLCCKKAPCAFGVSKSDTDLACLYLEGDAPGNYRCGIAEWIVTQRGWEHNPAFGAGCCMPLFNEDRERVLRERSNRGCTDGTI